MSAVLISIVVPTYNRLPELQRMLDSLLPQVREKPVEVLVSDDRSTDNTWEWLISRFGNQPGVRLFRMEENGGPGPARNLCLAAAQGEYFLPVDSDFIVMEGAIDRILEAVHANPARDLLFFPCIQYPAMRRLCNLHGQCEVAYDSFLADQVGELIPLARLSVIRNRNLKYPALRAGGETLLWAAILDHAPGMFIDSPIVLYRTDVSQRICTLEYQLAHPADLAEIADAMLPLYAGRESAALRSVHARKCLAAGTYHLLAGDMRMGRRRLVSALSLGCLPALAALAVSFTGGKLFRRLFGFYRSRAAKAYL